MKNVKRVHTFRFRVNIQRAVAIFGRMVISIKLIVPYRYSRDNSVYGLFFIILCTLKLKHVSNSGIKYPQNKWNNSKSHIDTIQTLKNERIIANFVHAFKLNDNKVQNLNIFILLQYCSISTDGIPIEYKISLHWSTYKRLINDNDGEDYSDNDWVEQQFASWLLHSWFLTKWIVQLNSDATL